MKEKRSYPKYTKEYVFSYKNYPIESDPLEIVIRAYQYAQLLFDPVSKTSIVNDTLHFYQKHMKKAPISVDTEDNILKENLYNELSDNRSYYSLFYLDYYLELFRIKGIEVALNELEEDVNIRAYTFYNAAYEIYRKILSAE